jgi:hypothetical protein
MIEQKYNLEGLRPAEHACEADPRNTMFVRIDRTNGPSRPIELGDHHELISRYVLHAGVPQEIVLQFETARNVYLYAWFVYRFYPVAEHQCLACLELALGERLKEEIRMGKIKGKRPALRLLLKYAVDNGLVRNEGFSAWQNRGEINSRARVEMEGLREASEKNLTEWTIDESDIQITAEDLDWDYVKMLSNLLPMLRNDYAHGSTDLHNWSLRSFQIVSEIINQLWQPPARGIVTGTPGPQTR